MTTEQIRKLMRTPKAQLVQMVIDDARGKGQTWVLGGPREWSKDELINYLAKEGRS